MNDYRRNPNAGFGNAYNSPQNTRNYQSNPSMRQNNQSMYQNNSSMNRNNQNINQNNPGASQFNAGVNPYFNRMINNNGDASNRVNPQYSNRRRFTQAEIKKAKSKLNWLVGISVFAVVCVFVIGFLLMQDDSEIPSEFIRKGFSFLCLLIYFLDAVFIYHYRGSVYITEKLVKKAKDYSKENNYYYKNNMICCDIFLYETSIILLMSLWSAKFYNYDNLIAWFMCVGIVATLGYLFIRKTMGTQKDRANEKVAMFIGMLFISVVVVYSLVNLTSTHVKKEVTVVSRETHMTTGKSKRRVYNIEFEYEDGKTETIEVSKKQYEAAKSPYYTFCIDEQKFLFDMGMHRMEMY
jgi:hypothetical protein